MLEVDSFLTYTRWCPGQRGCTNQQFLRVLSKQLLDNTYGCAPDAPVLRPRQRPQSCGSKSVVDLKSMTRATYFIGRKAAAEAAGSRLPQTVLKCRICRKNCSFYCSTCSHNRTKTSGIVVLCGLSTGRECFKKHHKTPGDSETDWEDLMI